MGKFINAFEKAEAATGKVAKTGFWTAIGAFFVSGIFMVVRNIAGTWKKGDAPEIPATEAPAEPEA